MRADRRWLLIAVGLSGCGDASGSSLEASNGKIPGGTYYRTYTNDGSGATGLSDPATVSTFRFDKYLITVGRFRQFLAASVAGWTPALGSGKHAHLKGGQGLADSAGPGFEPGWDATAAANFPTTADEWTGRLNCEPSFEAWTDTPGTHETLPMNCISWYEAYAFCIWDGGFLPSETEWEYAAAGGDEQRKYPWGSTDPASANFYVISGCNYPAGANGCTGVENLAPVGTATKGAGRWGQLDLVGDLSEWTLDWLGPYQPCTDCVFLTDSCYRVVRGGSFGTDTQNNFPAASRGDFPHSRNSFYGARCARAPD